METELVGSAACRSCFAAASALPERKPANFVLAGVFVNPVRHASWSPSQEACGAFLARRWQHLYCEQVLWECACERMCHTCVQAYPSLASSFGESGTAAGRVWSSMGCICWERPYRHRLLQVSVAENLGAEGSRTQGYKTCPEDAGTEHTVSGRSLAGTDGRWQQM